MRSEDNHSSQCDYNTFTYQNIEHLCEVKMTIVHNVILKNTFTYQNIEHLCEVKMTIVHNVITMHLHTKTLNICAW